MSKCEQRFKSMSRLLTDLSNNLSDTVNTYRKLLQFAKDAQEAILADQTEQLLKITEMQTSLTRVLKVFDENRMVLIEQIASYLQLPKDKLTLSQLISSVAEPYATNYARFRNELCSLISEIDTLNSQNARLIEAGVQLSLQQRQKILDE